MALSLALHLLLLLLFGPLWPGLTATQQTASPVPVRLVVEMPEETPEEEELPEPDLSGQLVDVPQPDEEERPDDSEYLAEHDRVVEEETRTEEFRINPEVLAEQFTEEDSLQFEDLIDLNIDEASTGATPGNDRFDPSRDGRLAALPSPFTLTNKDGLQRPVPSAASQQDLAGAPNNDLLEEELGTSVNLNTRELLGATYLNRIRRLVNFYWEQNIRNLSSVQLVRTSYTTRVHPVLDANGALESITVAVESGNGALDNAVLQAFRIAGPFPNPPEQLIEKDGRVYLGDMGFTVRVGLSRAPYKGVDPRQGVQFPGLLKSPR